MSHPAQQRFCLEVKRRFPDRFIRKRVLDVGSLDINGSNRGLFTDCDYVGLDLAAGPNVDAVCRAHDYAAADGSFDVVISTEAFEHDAHYAESLANIVRLLRPSGLLLFTCATTGRPEHGTRRSCPQDSPPTCQSHRWPDYYRNLTEQDIRRLFDPGQVFSEYEIRVEPNHHDLQFWGIKTECDSLRQSVTTHAALEERWPHKDARTLNLMYVGRFDRLWNECEITDALRRRGHRVTTCHEFSTSVEDVLAELQRQRYDALLFHKGRLGASRQADILHPSGEQIARLIEAAPVPSYMWYFDRAHKYDLAPDRQKWMDKVAPLCRIAFVTDGGLLQTLGANWRLLRQGAFNRQVREVDSAETEKSDLAFVGQLYGERHAELGPALERYEIDHVEDVFGPELTAIIRGHRVILGPRYPSAPGYWSNRLYLVLGHRGFFLAPEVDGMREDGFLPGVHYAAMGNDIVADIRYWLDRPADRQQIANQGRTFVLAHHTIEHRVAELCEAILDTYDAPSQHCTSHINLSDDCWNQEDLKERDDTDGVDRKEEDVVELVCAQRNAQTTRPRIQSPMIVTMVPYCPRPHGQNLGYAYNQMMSRLADDDWACFIDHDACFTTRDWYHQLEQITESLTEPCVLTAKTNRVNSPWQRVDFVDPNNHSMSEHRRIGEALAGEFGKTLTDVTNRSLMSGVVILLSKRTWQLLGGFSDGFFGVDNQLHQAARDRGFRVYLMEGLYVYHWYRAAGEEEAVHVTGHHAADGSEPDITRQASADTGTPRAEFVDGPDLRHRQIASLEQALSTRIPPSARHILVYDSAGDEFASQLDSSRRSAKRTNDDYENLSVVRVASIDELQVLSDVKPFDCIVCGDELARQRHPTDLLRQLRERLAGNGRLLALIPNSRHHQIVARLLGGTWHSSLPIDDTKNYVRHFTRREIEKLFYRTDFSTVELTGVSNEELEVWHKQGSPGEVQCGGLQMSGLDPSAAEEFFVDYYVASATPADRRQCGVTSIVIVTHNEVGYTRQCVNSLLQFTDPRFELIFVDNGSTDGTCEYLQALDGITLVINDKNRGFPAAANQGIKAARGEQILLLNNDTIVTTAWLDRMIAAMERDPTIGLVGPSSNNVSGQQKVPANYLELTCLDGFAWEWGKTHDGQIEDCERLVGFCLLIRREVVEKIGLLDERFGIGNFEDDDYCVRARQAGFRAVIARDAFVHHFGSRTFVSSSVDYPALMEENRQQFEEKWGGSRSEDPSKPSTRDSDERRYALRRHDDGGLILVPNLMKLSLCMIVRDNEKTIGPALQSIQPWVDELIVVDTGSKDQTPAIARSCGARVFQLPWPDSFAAARNESLSHASSEWIFWMDSDDTISPENGQQLRDLLDQPPPAHVFGYVVQVHCPNHSPDGDDDSTVVDHIKLFRNRPDLRFEGRIHEQIMPAIRRAGGEVVWTDIIIDHSGSDQTAEGRKRKQERDLRLLKLEERDCPDNSFVLFNIGMTFADMGEHSRAVQALERSIAVSDPSESHLRKAYALLIASLSQLGRFREADEVCSAGLSLFPNDVELSFREGFIAHHLGQLNLAIGSYRRALAEQGPRHFSSIDRGLTGYKTRHNLALVYEDLREYLLAEEQWRLVVAEVPAYRKGWHGLTDNLISQGKMAQASREVERLSSQDGCATDVFQIRSKIATARGDMVDARGQLELGLAQVPANEEMLDQLCKLLFECGELEEAVSRLTELVTVAPENASAWQNLGSAYLRQNRHQAAIAAFGKAIELRPDSAASHLYLGFALEQRGDHAGARSSFEQVIHVAPKDPSAIEAREHLSHVTSDLRDD